MAFVKHLTILAVCVGALAVTVYGADPMQCVQCGNYDTCADTIDIENVTRRCNTTADQICARYSYKTTNGITLTVRDCVDKETTCDNLQTEDKDKITDTSTFLCYTCETELCNKRNSAGSIGVSVASMVATVLFSLFMKYASEH